MNAWAAEQLHARLGDTVVLVAVVAAAAWGDRKWPVSVVALGLVGLGLALDLVLFALVALRAPFGLGLYLLGADAAFQLGKRALDALGLKERPFVGCLGLVEQDPATVGAGLEAAVGGDHGQRNDHQGDVLGPGIPLLLLLGGLAVLVDGLDESRDFCTLLGVFHGGG